jgi:hypothetical protein
MRTAVYQSFRTENVPSWISACMTSVRRWADERGYVYRFFDDSFFDLVPPELRERASIHKCVLADYARLVAAKNILREGFDRAIWLDADALIFAPAAFEVPLSTGYAFCREVWLDRTVMGRPQFKLTVNNAISVFCRDEAIIDFYLDCARATLSSTKTLDALSIGTDFLIRLRRAREFPLVTSMGIFGAEMAYRYMVNDGRFLRPYLNFQTSPIYAANLCLSHHADDTFRSASGEEWKWNEDTLLRFIAKLQSDGGSSLNAWFDNGYLARSSEFERPLSRYIGTKHAVKSLLAAVKGT